MEARVVRDVRSMPGVRFPADWRGDGAAGTVVIVGLSDMAWATVGGWWLGGFGMSCEAASIYGTLLDSYGGLLRKLLGACCREGQNVASL